MNKVYLKSYYANMNKQYKDKYNNKCIECITDYNTNEKGYLITDTYSIIKLNETYNMEITNDSGIIEKMFNDFKFGFNLNKVDITNDILECEKENFNLKKEYSGDIKEETEIIKYGVDMKRFNTIKNIIKANKIEIVSKYSYDYMYAIKIENTKTNEYAYLLPTRKF